MTSNFYSSIAVNQKLMFFAQKFEHFVATALMYYDKTTLENNYSFIYSYLRLKLISMLAYSTLRDTRPHALHTTEELLQNEETFSHPTKHHQVTRLKRGNFDTNDNGYCFTKKILLSVSFPSLTYPV